MKKVFDRSIRGLAVAVILLLIFPPFTSFVSRVSATVYPHDPRGVIIDIDIVWPTCYQGETQEIYVIFQNPTGTTYHYLVALNIIDSNGNTVYDSHTVTPAEDKDGYVSAGQTASFGPWYFTLPRNAPTGTYHVLAGLRLYPWDPVLDYMGLNWCEPEKTFTVKPSAEYFTGGLRTGTADYDSDGYPDSIWIEVEAGTNAQEALDVDAYGNLTDPNGKVVDTDGPGLWTVPAGRTSWSYRFYLYVNGGPVGMYSVDLYLYDGTHHNHYPNSQPEDIWMNAHSYGPLYPEGYGALDGEITSHVVLTPEVDPGSKLQVQVTVKNIGITRGEYNAYIGDIWDSAGNSAGNAYSESHQIIQLDPQTSQILTLEWTTPSTMAPDSYTGDLHLEMAKPGGGWEKRKDYSKVIDFFVKGAKDFLFQQPFAEHYSSTNLVDKQGLSTIKVSANAYESGDADLSTKVVTAFAGGGMVLAQVSFCKEWTCLASGDYQITWLSLINGQIQLTNIGAMYGMAVARGETWVVAAVLDESSQSIVWDGRYALLSAANPDMSLEQQALQAIDLDLVQADIGLICPVPFLSQVVDSIELGTSLLQLKVPVTDSFNGEFEMIGSLNGLKTGNKYRWMFMVYTSSFAATFGTYVASSESTLTARLDQVEVLPVSVDVTPPTTVLTSFPPEITNSGNVVFTWSGSDDKTPSDQLSYSHWLVGFDQDWSSPTSGTSWQYGNLPDGNYVFKVRAKDNSGNVEPVGARWYFLVDTTPPTGSVVINDGAVYTTSTSVTLGLSASDSGSGPAQMMVSNVQSFSGSSWEGYAITKAWSLTPGDGAKTVYVKYKDNAGLESSIYSDTIVLDTGVPSSPSPDDGVSGWSKVNTPTFSWGACSDSTSGVAGYWWKVDSGSETWTASPSVTLPPQSDGSHTFYVRAQDNAGNKGNYGSHGFQIDTIPPSTPNPDDGVSGPSSNSTPTFTWSCSDSGSGIAGYYWWVDSGPDTWTTSTSVTLSPQSDGSHTFYIVALDDAGNKGNCGFHGFQIATKKYVVVRGNDNRIYYRMFDFSSGTWGSWAVLPGATCDSPAAAVCSNKLYIVVLGMDGSTLWYGYLSDPSNPGSFTGWTLLVGATHSAPTLASNGTELCLAVRGLDNRVYYRCYSSSWGSWYAVPTGATCDGPAAAMLGNNLHLVVRGMDQTSLWDVIVRCDGTVYRDWIRVLGATSSKPALASLGSSENWLVVRGLDNSIYYRGYKGSVDSWGNWDCFSSGSTCDGPGTTILDNTLYVVVRGMDGNSLWYTYVNLSSGLPPSWTWVDGSTPSPPTLVS